MDGTQETEEMRNALSSIAIEIMRFKKTEAFLNSKTITAVKSKISGASKCICKANLRPKSTVAKLRKCLKAVCWIAIEMHSQNKRKTASLRNQLVFARGECVDLLERYNNNIDIIAKQHQQNKSLYDKLQNISNFIQLGYKQLRKIQSNRKEEQSTLVQLKTLIESCGQFYADYCNQYEINLQIKQKNRFLNNKLSILENNIAAMKENLKAMEYRNLRLIKEYNNIKAKIVQPTRLKYKVAYSELKIKQTEENEDESSSNKECGDSLQDTGKYPELTTHLEIVKQLLSDQDTLLKELTIISKEISIN